MLNQPRRAVRVAPLPVLAGCSPATYDRALAHAVCSPRARVSYFSELCRHHATRTAPLHALILPPHSTDYSPLISGATRARSLPPKKHPPNYLPPNSPPPHTMPPNSDQHTPSHAPYKPAFNSPRARPSPPSLVRPSLLFPSPLHNLCQPPSPSSPASFPSLLSQLPPLLSAALPCLEPVEIPPACIHFAPSPALLSWISQSWFVLMLTRRLHPRSPPCFPIMSEAILRYHLRPHCIRCHRYPQPSRFLRSRRFCLLLLSRSSHRFHVFPSLPPFITSINSR